MGLRRRRGVCERTSTTGQARGHAGGSCAVSKFGSLLLTQCCSRKSLSLRVLTGASRPSPTGRQGLRANTQMAYAAETETNSCIETSLLEVVASPLDITRNHTGSPSNRIKRPRERPRLQSYRLTKPPACTPQEHPRPNTPWPGAPRIDPSEVSANAADVPP